MLVGVRANPFQINLCKTPFVRVWLNILPFANAFAVRRRYHASAGQEIFNRPSRRHKFVCGKCWLD
jgi:hypothetical protein